jgi:hypothetical protein
MANDKDAANLRAIMATPPRFYVARRVRLHSGASGMVAEWVNSSSRSRSSSRSARAASGTTIRRWPASRPALRAGQRVFSPGLGWLEIDVVERTDLATLGDDDARADGFETAMRLRQVLASLYPEHRVDGKDWFRVPFRVDRLRPAPARGAAAHPELS